MNYMNQVSSTRGDGEEPRSHRLKAFDKEEVKKLPLGILRRQ